MKKLWVTFLKDAKLSFNSLYFYMELGLALVFLLIMILLVPEQITPNQTFHVHLDGPLESIGSFAQSYGIQLPDLEPLVRQIQEPDQQQGSTELESIQFHPTRESLVQAMEQDRSSIGVSVSDLSQPSPSMTMILQGFEHPRFKNLFQTLIEGELLSLVSNSSPELIIRTLEENPQRLTNRENLLPVYLTLNVGLMGLFIIAAYIFLDKEQGVIKAYAVAPVGIWQYLTSKLLIMLVVGLGTSLIVTLGIIGTRFPLGLFLGVILSFNLFGSTLGLFLSSFFDSMMKAMSSLYSVLMIMMVAGVSYFMPSFNPFWIRVFPTYRMFFTFRELFLPQGNLVYVAWSIPIYLGLSAGLFVLALHRFRKNLTE